MSKKRQQTEAPEYLITQRASQEEQRQEDNRKIKAQFRSIIPLGGNVVFYFRKYRNDPVEKYTFLDGEVYEIPKMVFDHIRENCYEPVHSHVLDEQGKPMVNMAGKKVKRFEMIPVGV